MAEERVFTRSGLQAAVAAAVAKERNRIAAITSLPEAAGREELALTLATTTELSVDQAKAKLAAAPIAAASGDASESPLGLSVEQPKPQSSGAEASSLWDRALKNRGMKVG